MLDYILPDFFGDEKVRMSIEPLVQAGVQHGTRCQSRCCSPATGFQNPAFRPDALRGRRRGDERGRVARSPAVEVSMDVVVPRQAQVAVEVTAKAASPRPDAGSASTRSSSSVAEPVPAAPPWASRRSATQREVQGVGQVAAAEWTPFHSAVISDSENTTASEFVSERIQTLVRAFSHRSQKVKERIVEPPTPSPSPPPEKRENYESRLRLDSFALAEDRPPGDQAESAPLLKLGCCTIKKRRLFPKTIDPQSKLYISWLFVVSLCFLYNCWAIFLRAVFWEGSHAKELGYLVCDYVCDLVYFLDILLFKSRIKFHSKGMWVEDPKWTRRNYIGKLIFKMDVASLLPLDFLYFVYGINPLLRVPRMLKVQTFWDFFNRIDALAKSPYIIRVLRTLLYMMYLIHLNACAYYAISKYEGIGSNPFVFQGGNKTAYVRCFYFAFKTATSIGKNAKPSNELEYMYMTVSWLLGVFLFAFLIGQVRDIVATATQGRTQCRQAVDACVRHLRRLGLPDDLQRRVRLWLNHTWDQKKTLDENSILATLPRKMKTDIAISVHYNTLAKVQFFQDCERSMLRDLVLKLQSVLFLPGDYICHKGEIGVEMYIVNKGVINVMGGENNNVVLATLTEGSVFGEVSLLGLPGFNRRTADVVSVGFSNLFVLSKDDLNDVLHYYPDVEVMLRRKAKSQMRKNQVSNEKMLERKGRRLRVEPIIKTPQKRPKTPKLVQTVMQVLRPESKTSVFSRHVTELHRAAQRPASSVSDSTSSSVEDLGKPTAFTYHDQDGVEQQVQTYHDITQNVLTLRATSATIQRSRADRTPTVARCKSSPAMVSAPRGTVICNLGDLKATAVTQKRTHTPFASLTRCFGSDDNASPESPRHQRWRKFSARSRITPVEAPVPRPEDGVAPPRNPDSIREADDTPKESAEHASEPAPDTQDISQPTEDPTTAQSAGNQEQSNQPPQGTTLAEVEDSDSLKSTWLPCIEDDDDDSEQDNLEFVSPHFLSSSSLSWNFDEPPC
ncbi:unnamed protein product [Ixodes hexagonus]